MSNIAAGKRLCILLPSLHLGGVEKMMLNLAGGIDPEQYGVDIVVLERKGDLLRSVPGNVEVFALSGESVGLVKALACALAFRRYLRTRGPRVVISAKERANLLNVLARIAFGGSHRSVITRHVPLDGKLVGRDATRGVRWLYRTILGKADRIIAVSSGIADDIRSLLPGRDRQKVEVISNPVVDDSLVRMSEEGIDEPWLAPGHGPVIVASGRLSHQKGFDILIDAFAQLRERLQAKLIILGDGELKGRLMDQVRSRSLESDIKLLGAVKNPYPYYRRADVFVLSSRWEGQPLVLIEALALGTPVVATDCRTGPAEILRQGRFGALVPPEVAAALAQGIYQTLKMADKDIGVFPLDEYRVATACRRYEKMMNSL
jgi:glycosyltransferase involved in cell wall biosynthesis